MLVRFVDHAKSKEPKAEGIHVVFKYNGACENRSSWSFAIPKQTKVTYCCDSDKVCKITILVHPKTWGKTIFS
jgi:hypothetical protein